jgi:hypothetical protein
LGEGGSIGAELPKEKAKEKGNDIEARMKALHSI